MVILDESESYLLALRATPKQSAEVQDVDRDTNGDRDTATDPWKLLRRAREADNPEEAARLDDELLESIERSRRSRARTAASFAAAHARRSVAGANYLQQPRHHLQQRGIIVSREPLGAASALPQTRALRTARRRGRP